MKIDVVEKDGLFELDLQIHTEEATTITELWSLTDDGCKPTCQTACTPSCTDNGK